MSKPRPDSRLKNLPAETQAKIFAWLRGTSLEAVKDKVREELGIKTNHTSLSEFNSWYALEESLHNTRAVVDGFRSELLANPNLPLDPDRVNAAAENLFVRLLMQQGNPRLWLLLKKGQRLERIFKAERNQWQFHAATLAMTMLDKLNAINSDKALMQDAKIAAAHRLLFGRAKE